MKSFIVAGYDTSGKEILVLKLKAPDESRAVEVAERLKSEGKLDTNGDVSFSILSPKK